MKNTNMYCPQFARNLDHAVGKEPFFSRRGRIVNTVTTVRAYHEKSGNNLQSTPPPRWHFLAPACGTCRAVVVRL